VKKRHRRILGERGGEPLSLYGGKITRLSGSRELRAGGPQAERGMLVRMVGTGCEKEWPAGEDNRSYFAGAGSADGEFSFWGRKRPNRSQEESNARSLRWGKSKGDVQQSLLDNLMATILVQGTTCPLMGKADAS